MGRPICTAIAVLSLAAAPAAQASLPSGPPPRPGPDLLYAKPRPAPQLENRGIWRARPLLVSGASGYRRGEFLYQDYLYDDTGAKGSFDADDPRSDATFARFNGTFSYPRDPAYAQNVADLVELRVRALRRATAFRLTFNSMTDPGLVATTIAIGDSEAPRPFPHGAGVRAPARLFLTVHGDSAELLDARTGEPRDPEPRVRVSTRRRQIELRIARRAWDPGSRRIRLAAGTGLWDRAADRYLVPSDSGTSTRPGGAGGLADPPAFFNVGFRFDEPLQDVSDVASVFEDPRWWRDDAQAQALADGDISRFFAVVRFRKLRRGATDLMRGRPGGVPASGPMNRIVSSRFSFGQGADWGVSCPGTGDCSSQLLGRLLPYSIYVPPGPRPPRGWGLTLLLHSLGANYNQFSGTRNQAQLGDRAPGSIVITPSGRGTDGWYYGAAGADAFEVWADVAARHRLDPRLTAISGYSMGGYGTYKLAAQFPDLFAAGQPVVGPPGQGAWVPPAPPTPGGAASNTNRMLPSLRHVPLMIWNGVLDELVPIAGPLAQVRTLDELGYEYSFFSFPTADHFALAANDSYGPAAQFLGHRRARRNPARVTYVVNPSMDFPRRRTVADHAYWLSGLRLREPAGDAALGIVDAVSHGFGRADRIAGPTRTNAGALPPGTLGPLPYAERRRELGPAPRRARADRLELAVENLRRIVVHVRRARLSCRPRLGVETDGPLTVKLAGCRGKKRRFG